MMEPAMSFSMRIEAAALALAATALMAPLPLAAQVMPEPDAKEVAKTPLRDLNIDARDIPEKLKALLANPYDMTGMGSCKAIIAQMAELDGLLGADYDIADEEKNDRLSEGRIGQKVVGSFIPFRGILREVTGAASHDRALRAAYTAGMVRRGFLKGVGLGRGCKYPARPKPVAKGK